MIRRPALLFFAFLFTSPCFADINVTGEVVPDPPESGDTVTVARGSTLGTSTVLGRLVIDGGSTLDSNDGIVGQRAGARGTVRVEGDGSTWSINDDLSLGSSGTGNLNVVDGGAVLVGDVATLGVSGNGYGNLTVSGQDSVVVIDDHLLVNAGRAIVEDSAWATAGRMTIGSNHGEVVVSGASLDISNTIRVGALGRGALRIQQSGAARATNLTVGGPSSAEVLVAGVGSSVNLSGTLTVGSDGSGIVQIEDGALLSASNVDVTDGYVKLSGGILNAPAVELTSGGHLSGYGTVEARLNNASGHVAVGDDELLHFAPSVGTHTNASQVSVIGGEIVFDREVTNSGQIVGRDSVYRFNGGLTNAGLLGLSSGDSDVFGDVQNTGSLTIDGISTTTFYDAVTSTGTLEISPDARGIFLGGLDLGAASRLNLAAGEPNDEGIVFEGMTIGGDLQAQGTLDVDLSRLATLENPGDTVTVDILSSAAIAGNFAQVLFDGLVPTVVSTDADGSFLAASSSIAGGFERLEYGSDGIQVSRYLTIPGDANGDLEVGFADFLLLSGNFGQAGSWNTGDFDASGTTDFADFLILSAEFGNSVIATPVTQSVPEPSGAWLLSVAALLMGTCRRRLG